MGKKTNEVNAAAMNDLARRHYSIPGRERRIFAAKDFLEPLYEHTSPTAPAAIRDLVRLCAVARGDCPPGVQILEEMLEADYSANGPDIERFKAFEMGHRYVGTLAIAILHAARKRHGAAGWAVIRKHARRHWRDTILLDLVEALGRPTVPANLLPVFALYEVERRQGEPVGPLSSEQVRLLGL